MGLHLGWIPNEPGLRTRDFAQPAPAEPAPDPRKVAALAAAQHARGLWSRLLIAFGLMALVLLGFVAAVAHITWGWAVAGGLAACCWVPVALLGIRRRRAASRLRVSKREQAAQHASAVAAHEDGKAKWAEAEAERIAAAPRWLQVAAHEDVSRLDVFGGTGSGRQNMVTGLGWELLAQRAVIVLDLTQGRVAGGLLAAAHRAGMSAADYGLPADLGKTPLLSGLTGEQIASLIVEVVHADDASATAAGRATDLMILKKIIGVLAGDASMGRLHAALTVLLGDGSAPAGSGTLTRGEQAGLAGLFGDGFRRQVTGNLVRLAAVVEPLTDLGTTVAPPEPARLTCLSLAEGPRDVAADLTAALVVQWVTRAVSSGDGSFRPAVILAGADEQSTRHLGRLTAVCERYDIPLVRTFSRLTEESARHLDTRHTAFMRLATRPEALRAAEHIGLERQFVAGRFSHAHSVSRSLTRTTSESVTHTSGRTEGEAKTHTTGTTTGQAYSEAEVPRRDQQVHVHVEDHRPQGERGGERREEPDHRVLAAVREPSGRESAGGRRDGGGRDARNDKSVRGAAEKGTGVREAAGVRDAAEKRTPDPRPRGRAGSGFGGSGFAGKRPPAGPGKENAKPQFDIVKTRTWFTAHHESDSTTKSWSTTEENSHTASRSTSRTDGVRVGDEISYELVYDHKVQPETLMALPEDQMLAPHIVEAAPDGAVAVTESKMVALVIDPAAVGTDAVAPVRPHEIPAFKPPVPAIPVIPRGDDPPYPAGLPARWQKPPSYRARIELAFGVGTADSGSSRGPRCS
ncbi:MAG: hypothetical protein ACRDNW_04180 [Trebonia sp.]